MVVRGICRASKVVCLKWPELYSAFLIWLVAGRRGAMLMSSSALSGISAPSHLNSRRDFGCELAAK